MPRLLSLFLEMPARWGMGVRVVLLASLGAHRAAAVAVPHQHGRAMELLQDGSMHLIRREHSASACEVQCVLNDAPVSSWTLPAKYFTEAAAHFLDAAVFYKHCLQVYRDATPSQREDIHDPDGFPDIACLPELFHKGVRHFITKRTEDELLFDQWGDFLQNVSAAEGFASSNRTAALNNVHGVRTAVKAQFSVHIGTLFAARQAYVALGSIRSCAVEDVLKEISQQLTILHTSINGSLPNSNAAGWKGDLTEAWLSSKNASDRLLAHLRTPRVASLLDRAATCARPFNHSILASALPFQQHTRVKPPLPQVNSSSVIMIKGPTGALTPMPMLGLGTGYDDCFQGHALETDASLESEVETISSTNEKCHNMKVPENWGDSAFRLVDTAALYGTERIVGKALAEALNKTGLKRKDFFVITKPPVKAMLPMLRINSSSAYLGHQLEDLQTDYVDVLLYHHDGFEQKEWAAMERSLAQGRARMLGMTGIGSAEDVVKCLEKGQGCDSIPAIAQDQWSPCSPLGLQKLGPRAEAAGVTLLATGVIWPCLKEPHIAAIARRLGVSSPAVSTRFALQNGVPSLVQTHKAKHLHAAGKALEISLSDVDMAHIGLLPLLYRYNTPGGSYADGPGLSALGISSSHALGF